MSVTSTSAQPESTSHGRGGVVVHDRRVAVDGITTQYLEAGTGPHDAAAARTRAERTSWRWVIPALARTHRVLALSLPGHGDTAQAARLLPGQRHRPVRRRLPRHPRRRAAARGRTLGRRRGRRAAGPRRPRTASGPWSWSTAPGSGREVHPLLAVDTLPLVGELAILLSRLPGGDLGRTTMSAAMLFAQPWRAPAEFLAEQHDRGRRPGQLEASTAMARALFDPTGQRQILLDQLPAITAPTLVVWGASDYVLPAHQAQTAVNLLPHGRLALLPDCGHLPHVEHPDRFAAVLSNWLTEHHAPSSNSPPDPLTPGLRSRDPPRRQPNRARRDRRRTDGHTANARRRRPGTARGLRGLPQPGRSLRPAHRRLPPLARTAGRAATRPAR